MGYLTVDLLLETDRTVGINSPSERFLELVTAAASLLISGSPGR